MSSDSVTAPLTMRTFLFDDGAGGDTAEMIGRTLREHGVARSALAGIRNLSTSAAQSVDREVGNVVDGLLGLDLGDILVSCWRKHRALVEAAKRTLAAPGSEEVVILARHRATATYRPAVDLLVDGRKVTTFDFTLAIVFEATGLEAVVRMGELVALQGGDCLATATLTLEGARLAERQRHFDPALVVSLHPGVVLVDRATTTPDSTWTRGGSITTAR